MTYSTRGIILLRRDTREADRAFVVYTREFGKKLYFLRSAKQSTNKLSGHLDPFSEVQLTIAPGKSGEHITTVDLMYRPLDAIPFLRLVVAYYFFEVVDQLVKWESDDEEFYLFLRCFLHDLFDTDCSSRAVLAFYLLRFLDILGVRPEDVRLRPVYGEIDSRGGILDTSFLVSSELFLLVQKCVRHHIDRPLRSQVYLDYLTAS